MARGLNEATLIGNLGKDPELTYSENGTATARFTMATSESWNDKAGERQERTTWHNITVYGKLAEVVGEYLKKGSRILCKGSIENRQYEDADSGQTKYYSGIKMRDMLMLDGRSEQAEAEPAEAEEPKAKSPSNADDLPF